METTVISANDLLQNFRKELVEIGYHSFEGEIGKKYQPFVEYWCDEVGRKHGDKNIKKVDTSSSELFENFYQELLDIGYYSFDGKIGKEYSSFIEFWVHVAKNCGNKFEL